MITTTNETNIKDSKERSVGTDEGEDARIAEVADNGQMNVVSPEKSHGRVYMRKKVGKKGGEVSISQKLKYLREVVDEFMRQSRVPRRETEQQQAEVRVDLASRNRGEQSEMAPSSK